MSKRKEKLFLFFSDLIFVNIAWVIYYYIRIETGWINYANPPSFLIPMIVVYFYWLIIFSFSGLYQYWFVRSRFDEFASVFRIVSIGAFILFFVIFIDDTIKDAPVVSRYVILIYWILMVLFVGFGRVLIRGFQRSLLQKGIGLRNSVIIGSGERAIELYDIIEKSPQLGLKFAGFVGTGNNKNENDDIGNIHDLPNIVKDKNISEILIALEKNEKEKALDVIKYCSGLDVSMKIMPDTYEIVSGLVKTNQIYGVPLIEVMPELLSPAASLSKRIIDIFISIITLLFLSPLLIFICIIIKLTSKGPIIIKQKRVGKNGKLFTLYKFRSMIENAEEYGPEWAGEDDPRITNFGRFLRKTHIDEIPQMINVIKNQMSIVGPRPEREFFVNKLKKEIPYYYKRLSIKPGITGWAQIKYTYDSSLGDVKSKLQFDFYYIENMSLKLDFKILINTFIVILFMRGH